MHSFCFGKPTKKMSSTAQIEVELKIELKVYVNCCDGCRKKVKKALIGIEGVFKIDIDPEEPKVTVYGKVHPRLLIHKLRKVGKIAQLSSVVKVEEEKKEEKKEERKEEKKEENKDSVDGSKDMHANSSSNLEVNNSVVPAPSMNPNSNIQTHHPHGCCIHHHQPCAVAAPYHGMPPPTSYTTPPAFVQNQHYQFVDQQRFQPPAQPAWNYFSDENTTGCSVM